MQLDDALNAQHIASEALDATNGENRQLAADASAREEENLKLKSDLDECLKENVEVEAIRNSVMAENEDLAKKFEDADANFVANFHLIEEYTSFSNYFASVGQQEVITALRSERPDLDFSFLEAKFPPMDIEKLRLFCKNPSEEAPMLLNVNKLIQGYKFGNTYYHFGIGKIKFTTEQTVQMENACALTYLHHHYA
ncbi:hypothetical protein Fot_38594 [Forsythia ovata]|uniref:Uncharacterized protein n=1 Tax=Forsythia ovata TaxID=205694 RepID=A0ABD1S2C3_9LAMI